MPEEWPLIEEEQVYDARIFKVVKRRCRSTKDGREHDFTCIDSPSWVMVLPITADGRVILVRQYRQGSQALSLELPGGVIDPGQTPLEAAARELREETGYVSDKWRPLGALRPNPAIYNNTQYAFVAEDVRLEAAQDFDENEDIELVTAPLADLKKLLAEGAIDHALMAAMISRYLLNL